MELERQFLISYISDCKNIIEVLGKKINKKVFGNEVYGWLFELTTWFCQRYSNFPTVNEFEVLLTRSKKINVDTQVKMLLEYRELVKEKETVKDTFSFLLESLLKDYQKRLLKDVLINTGESYKARNIEELLTDLRSKVVQISEVGKSDSVAGPISESTDDRWNSYVNVRDFPDKFKGIHLGFPTFDQITGGLRKGQLMVVMAGAKEGKSTFLSNVGHNAHINGANVLFVTIEMTKQQCERRYDAIDTELDYSLIRDGTLTKVEEDIYKQSLERQKNNKCLYYIYDTPNATVSMIKAKVKSLNQPIDLIVVDYLGIMDSDLRISENWEKVGSIAKELKTLAKDLDVPVLTAAQVNREGIKQQNYKYGKESIALSFLIIAHADIVLSLRNPDPDIQEVSDLLDINATVVANRDDKTFRFQLETCFKKILMKERTFVGGALYGNNQTNSNKDSNKNGTTVTGNVSEARTNEGSVDKSDVTGDRPF